MLAPHLQSEEVLMAKFITLGRFRSGVDFSQAPARVEKVKKALAAVNGKLDAVYYTMGSYDFVAIIDAPDNEAAAAYAAWYAKLGVAETTTMTAMSLEQMVTAASRIK
jgi:uncharacterized protein with GYD domain